MAAVSVKRSIQFINIILNQFTDHWVVHLTVIILAYVLVQFLNSPLSAHPHIGAEPGRITCMRMQVILDSSFRPPGFSPYMGVGR